MKNTIAAIATGLTDSGIGIIRISGEGAVETGSAMFRSSSGKNILAHGEDHKMYYGFVYDRENELYLDEALAVVMRAPRSYTGEDTVEIQCHGGVLVMQKVLELSLKCGARMAEPGEFTKRAFLNGKIDLSMAEAVMDVIQSQNESALSASVNQMRGSLSKEIRGFREKILYELAYVESALDDPEHISLEGYTDELYMKMCEIENSLEKLLKTAGNGRLIKEGIQTVILGKPNVGKSSLLNCLVGEERSIVTEVAGTTRDVIRETIRLGNISLNIVDTAGIRDTEDMIEKIGVERAYAYAEEADMLLYVVDASLPLDDDDSRIVEFIKKSRLEEKTIVLLNKSDLHSVVSENDIRKIFLGKAVKTSTRDGNGMDELEKTVKHMFFQGEIKSSNEIIITNSRHREALREAEEAIKHVKESIAAGYPEDFYSIDLMSAYTALGRIIGQEVEDDLVEEIFSKFCMGK